MTIPAIRLPAGSKRVGPICACGHDVLDHVSHFHRDGTAAAPCAYIVRRTDPDALGELCQVPAIRERDHPMTPEQHVIDTARAWHALRTSGPVHELAEAERVLASAVAALTTPDPQLPEPGIYTDAHAGIWIIHPNGGMEVVGTGQGCDWVQGQQYGPFERLLPATTEFLMPAGAGL